MTFAAFLLLLLARSAAAQADIDFLREEGLVTSASHQAHDVARAPATVYVVTARHIRESGAQTIWEALRGVPGVDVMRTRSMQGEVGIRGLNYPMSNRALVLIDGRTVLNGYFDFALWESLPLSLDAIDRIEIVEGPASAVYGPNALSGVINIITRKPEDMGTARTSVTYGEDGLVRGSAMHGRKAGAWAYKLDVGWRSAEHFDSDARASQAKFAGALLSRDFGDWGLGEVSAGVNSHRTQFSAAAVSAPYDVGTTGFVRGDWRRGGTKFRSFWNYNRTAFRGVPNETNIGYDTYDAQLVQSFAPLEDHEATVGLEYRNNTADSLLFGAASPRHAQELWGGFLEDEWAVNDQWSLNANARVDRHPLAGTRFSPRGSVVWSPRPQHTLRASVGTAFRNPTLVENHIRLTQTVGAAQFTRLGSEGLRTERALQGELAYVGQLRAARVRAATFMYHVRDPIQFTQATLVSAVPPRFNMLVANVGNVHAWGGEAGIEAPLGAGLTGSAGWSYEALKDDAPLQFAVDSAPKNKASGSLTWRGGGWTLFSEAFWQSAVLFRANAPTQAFIESERLPDYWLLSARIAYAFAGKLEGLEAAVSAWNLADRRHFETNVAQNGEILGRRLAGTLSWRFQ